MAKNTSSSAFRKIDVDQYNEDIFKEDDVDGGSMGPDENEIAKLLTQYPLQKFILFTLFLILFFLTGISITII